MQVDEKESRPPVTPSEPASEPLTPLPPDAEQPEDDEDDSPDAIFFRAVIEIPTQPLPRHFTPQWKLQRSLERHCTFLMLLIVLSLLATAVLNIVNQPVVTVTLLPIHKSVQLTTTLPIPTRTLAPVTINRTLTAPTTGKGHQDARAATGTLTFYNGQSTAQIIPIGSVFTGNDGVKITTDEAVTIPAANAPSWGIATISAHAINPGGTENIQALDINSTVSSAVFVKNLAAFTGGEDARDYKAVSRRDLDTLTAKLQQQLDQEIPQAFSTHPGEEVTPVNCAFTKSADHGLGDEAQMLTVKASKTCAAIAYNQDTLQQKVVPIFNATRPGRQYELVNSVQTTVLSVSPFLVHVSGQWSYVFMQNYEQYLAEQIQGETPAQARAYLFKTGLVSRVTITQTQTLPDFYHIKFLILIRV